MNKICLLRSPLSTYFFHLKKPHLTGALDHEEQHAILRVKRDPTVTQFTNLLPLPPSSLSLCLIPGWRPPSSRRQANLSQQVTELRN